MARNRWLACGGLWWRVLQLCHHSSCRTCRRLAHLQSARAALTQTPPGLGRDEVGEVIEELANSGALLATVKKDLDAIYARLRGMRHALAAAYPQHAVQPAGGQAGLEEEEAEAEEERRRQRQGRPAGQGEEERGAEQRQEAQGAEQRQEQPGEHPSEQLVAAEQQVRQVGP